MRGVHQAPIYQSSSVFRRDDHGRNRGTVISICMLTAVCLWVLLSLDDPGEIRLELPTVIANQPEDMAFAQLPASSVMASAKGDILTLFKLKYSPPAYTIDASLDQVESSGAVDWPPGVEARFDSPHITLARERRIARKVPVRSRVQIRPATSYSLFDPWQLAPDSVVLQGAVSIIQNIDAWPTVAMRRVGIKDSLLFEVPLLDSLSGLVVLSHTHVTLRAHAHQFTEGLRTLRVTVTDIPNAGNVVDLDPPQVEVRFHVPEAQYNAVLAAEDFYATVSYEAIRRDTSGSVSPVITLPADLFVRLVDMQPPSLSYFVNTGMQ